MQRFRLFRLRMKIRNYGHELMFFNVGFGVCPPIKHQ